MKFVKTVAVSAALLAAMGQTASAEINKLVVAEQFGIVYLQLMVMREEALIEKHAKALGVEDLAVDWVRLSGSGPMNDALISGNLHIASGGLSGLITLWDRTKGSINVRGISAMNSMPIQMISNNPAIKSVTDLGPQDRIAVPSIRVSPQAVLVQIAAERAFGEGKHGALDANTVSLPNPDAAAALISKSGGVAIHVANPPYDQRELREEGFHTLATSYDLVSPFASLAALWATEKFYDENPNVTAAFRTALAEATDKINADPQWAAELYLRVTKEDDTVENLAGYLTSPEVKVTLEPSGFLEYTNFMAKYGTIKNSAAEVDELFFPGFRPAN